MEPRGDDRESEAKSSPYARKGGVTRLLAFAVWIMACAAPVCLQVIPQFDTMIVSYDAVAVLAASPCIIALVERQIFDLLWT